MSKNSAKQNLECLQGWINTLNYKRKTNPKTRNNGKK